MKRDGAVKAGDAGGHIGTVDLLKAEHRSLQAALVLRVHLLDGKAMLHIIGDGQIIGAARGQGDVHGGDDLIPLRGAGFCQRVFLIGGQVTPHDLPVAVGSAGDGGAAIAGQGELGPLQGSAARTGLDNLQAGGFGFLRAAPLKGDLGVQGGVAGVGDDIGLLRGGGVVGQEKVILRHAARGLDGEAALGGHIVHGEADLECAVIFRAVGVEIGVALSAGIHQIAGGSVLLHGFQRGVVLRHKDGALGGVGGVHLGLAPVDPGGGGGGQIHHTGIILFPVDGFFLDAVLVVLGSALQTVLVEDFYPPDVFIFLGPEGQAGVEAFRPMLGQTQDGLHAVEDTDFLCVCGGRGEGVTARRKGGAGDGKLAAGGPNRQLRGVFVLILGQRVHAPHIVLVQFLKLFQRSVRVAACEHAHRLRVAVVGLDGQGLGGGYPS